MADKHKIEQLEKQLEDTKAALDAEVKGRQEERAVIAELINALQEKDMDHEERKAQLAELEDRCKIRENFNEEQLLQALEEAKTEIKRLEQNCANFSEELNKMEGLLFEEQDTQAEASPFAQQVQQFEMEKKWLESELEDANRRCDLSTQAFVDAQEEHARLEADVYQECSTAKEELRSLKIKYAATERELGTLKWRFNEEHSALVHLATDQDKIEQDDARRDAAGKGAAGEDVV